MLHGKLINPEVLHGRLHTGETPVKTQSKEVAPTKEVQIVRPDAGYLLSSVTVDAYPDPLTQSKTATPSEQEQTVLPDEGYLLDEVTVNPIPSEYHDTSNADIVAEDVKRGKVAYAADGEIIGTSDAITPSGTIQITQNGTVDVTPFASASVNTNPNIGLVFTDFTEDGYPQTIKTYGYTSLPSDFLIDMGARNYQTRTYFSRVITYVFLNDELSWLGSSSLRSMNRVKEIYFPASLSRIDNFCWYGDVYLELLDFTRCTTIPALEISGNNALPTGCKLRIPSALSDTTLGEGNGWESATNWCDLTNIVWEVA